MDKYGASVFIVTFVVDFLLLRGAAQGDRRALSRIRAVLGAVIGAGYALLALDRTTAYMILPVLLLMGAVAFGFGKDGIGKWGKFVFLWLVSNAMAVGVANMNGWFLILAAALLCLLALVGPNGGAGKKFADVTIQYGSERVRIRALRDNGNLLRDPVTGQSVLIVSPWVGSKLLGLSPKELMQSVETVASGKVAGLRLIPYSTVGQPGGLIMAMRFRDVTVDGETTSQIVAFSPNPIGDGRRFEALAGGTV